MRKYVVALAASVALCAPAVLLGQDFGWVALLNTPVGALPPMLVLPAATGPSAATLYQVRYGHWNLQGASTNTVAGAVSLATGTSRVALEIGLAKSSCSDCRTFLAGVDMTIPIAALNTTPRDAAGGVFSVAFNPAVGFAKPLGDNADGYALSLAGNVPFSVSFKAGQHSRVAPFLSPGGGVGRLAGEGDSETGFRWMLGGGVTIADLTPGFQITGSFRKIFVDGGPTTFGLGVTFGK